MNNCTYQVERLGPLVVEKGREPYREITEGPCGRTGVKAVRDPLTGRRWVLCKRHDSVGAARVIAESGYESEALLVA